MCAAYVEAPETLLCFCLRSPILLGYEWKVDHHHKLSYYNVIQLGTTLPPIHLMTAFVPRPNMVIII